MHNWTLVDFDLKPEIIEELLNSTLQPQFQNFWTSFSLVEHQKQTRYLEFGTPITSPNFQNSKGYLVKDFVDAWSFGILILCWSQENYI